MSDTKEKKYFVFQTGCGVNKANARRYENYMEANGVKPTTDVKEADYIVINTCAVDQRSILEAAINISRSTITHPKNPEVVVVGCLVDRDRAFIERMFHGPILDLNEIEENPDIFQFNGVALAGEHPYFFPKEPGYVFDSGKPADYYGLINICTGCLHRCTYCTHHMIFDEIISLPPEKIVALVQEGIDRGVREFILWAQDIYAYGKDNGADIVSLLKKLVALSGDFSLNLGGMNPKWLPKVIDPFTELLETGRIIKMEFPIQTGSPRLLKLMGRRYDEDKLVETIARFKEAHPPLMVHTHAMLGFPTETEVDVLETARVLRRAGFTSVSIFAFTPHRETKAGNMDGRIPANEIRRRFKLLEQELKGSNIYVINYVQFPG